MDSKVSYADFVRARKKNNPCIDGLAEYLVKRPPLGASSTVVLLEYSAVGEDDAPPPAPSPVTLTENELARLFGDAEDSPPVSGRVLLVENIHSGLVELLGQRLDIDPMFFASYISTDFQGIDMAPPNPSLALYPSQIAERGHLHIHYQQVVDMGQAHEFEDSVYLFRTETNVLRNIRRLPKLSSRQLALTRGCCSIFTKRLGRIWYTIILTDPTVKTVLESPRPNPGDNVYRTAEPLHGGFEDFEQLAYFSSNTPVVGWDKSSMLQSIVHYFQKHPPGFDVTQPTILSIGYYPLRIVMAEWMLYSQLVSRYLKYYEYSLQALHRRPHESDIVDLQRWRRRISQSQHKLHLLAEFIDHWLPAEPGNKQPWEMLLKDIGYIRSQLQAYSSSMERAVPVATAMVQLLDAKNSVRQAANVTLLTYIALVFVPLSWVTGLFSMSDGYSPGQEHFWLYFATALPLALVVLLVSAVPFYQPDSEGSWGKFFEGLFRRLKKLSWKNHSPKGTETV